ncbi:MAG TPA: acyl-CoA dehydrogenase family protein [Burkholderiales bacterium]|nr:acyl-CoA dehydrogenase family protein [Burkholderiales bacterium]
MDRQTRSEWIAIARALTPVLAAAAPRIEEASELTSDVLDALHEKRLFRMLLPKSTGGAELDLGSFFQVAMALAEGDASTAWCVVQNAGCALSAAYLAPAPAREIFGGARDVLAWGFAAPEHCRATPVEGGWKVSGTWAFGSGSRHATWLGGHCQLTDAGGKPQSTDGRPIERTMLFPRSKATIKGGLWNVIGLRGTGSDSYSVQDLFVPAEHCIVPRATGRDQQVPGDGPSPPEPERREQGTLYRFTGTNVYQCGFAGVALGVARAMLNSFIALARKKTPAATNMALKDDHSVQARVAVSEARLGSAAAWIAQTLDEMWQEAAASGRIRFEQRVRLRLASTYAIQEARAVAEDAYADAGATAIFQSQPFERRLRDMHAVSQQVQASSAHFQTTGQYYLGEIPNTRFI